MTNLTKAIRSKRFAVKDGSKISFTIESKTGTHLELEIQNCSLTGLGATYKGEVPKNEGFEIGDIIPASKLRVDSSEFALGRLVLRNMRVQGENAQYLAFSTIDSRVPVNGLLNRYLDVELSETGSGFDFELSPDKFSVAAFGESAERNVDIFAKCSLYAIYFSKLKSSSRYLYEEIRQPSMGPRVKLARRRSNGRSDFLMMGSNDYLGLASHPEVMESAQKAIAEYGFGATGSPVTTGLSRVHEDLSMHLARMFKKDRVLLYNSGYAANVGCVQGLAGPQDLVVADMISHASIQDALELARSTSRYFKHNDAQHLDKVLTETRAAHAGALVVTEGVFSMDGDVPPLREIVAVAKKHHARVFVDEAHSFGVVGPSGMGTVDKFGLTNEVDIIMGTFSKICGGIGGFIAASKEVIDWLHTFSRPYMFSAAVPPSTAAAALKALEIFQREPALVETLKKNVSHFVDGLRSLGFNLSPHHESAVIPVIIGDETKMTKIIEVLVDAGIYVTPVVFPAVSRTGCRLRFTISAKHTISDLDYVVDVLNQALKSVALNPATDIPDTNVVKMRKAA